MQWIHEHDLYLFDFDGLLVNTESLHHKAYQTMCAGRGYELSWSFPEYAEIAHTDPTAIRRQIYKDFPELFAAEPHWDVLYKEKTQAYLNSLKGDEVELMPGAELFLRELEKRHKKMCVVTNSRWEMIEPIIDHNPVLEIIQHWVTREDYSQPKPDPECYRVAMERYLSPGGRVIGFEDSPRGLNALLSAEAESILITLIEYLETPKLLNRGAKRFGSLDEFMQQFR